MFRIRNGLRVVGTARCAVPRAERARKSVWEKLTDRNIEMTPSSTR